MKPSRNQPCYCGSGRKYKKCCRLKDVEKKAGEIVSRKKIKPSEFDILKEVEYITNCAKNENSRLVALGSFILFSTVVGDAWLLEQNEKVALCLMRDGEKQPYLIKDTAQNFMIDWDARYQLDDEKFIIKQNNGRLIVRLDYPARDIANVRF